MWQSCFIVRHRLRRIGLRNEGRKKALHEKIHLSAATQWEIERCEQMVKDMDADLELMSRLPKILLTPTTKDLPDSMM